MGCFCRLDMTNYNDTIRILEQEMTRINIIPVEQLSDQHLIAEYRELPRVLKQQISTVNAPSTYKLGTGHVKWAKKHSKYVTNRYIKLVDEMKYRGFKTNFTTPPEDIYNKQGMDYVVSKSDIEINRARIKAKYNQKPDYYKWSKRNPPEWLYS